MNARDEKLSKKKSSDRDAGTWMTWDRIHPPFMSMGFPTIKQTITKTLPWKTEIIITPDTDMTDPMVLEFIRDIQKSSTENPPQPIQDKNNPKKLDWANVYEWYLLHPLFTAEDIAERIGYEPQRVRLKFSELASSNKNT